MGIRSDIATARDSHPHVIDGVLAIFAFLFAFWCSHERLIARDEGFYTFAAQLVVEGKHPYIDFFYPQMPLLPYLYAFGGLLWGSSWESYRVVSGTLFGGILLLFYCILRRHVGWRAGAIGVVMLATCHLGFAWYSLFQTYAGSVFFLLLGLFLLDDNRLPTPRVLMAGIAFALAVQARLFFAPLMALPLLYFFFAKSGRGVYISYLIGIFLGSLPSLIFIALSPRSFYFSNLGYHLIRSERELVLELGHKWRVFEVLFSLGRPSAKFDGIQTPFIFTGMFGALLFFKHLPPVGILSLLSALILFGVSFLPNPTYVQYFSAVMPFALLPVVLLVASFLKRQQGISRVVLLLSLSLLLALYLVYLPSDIRRYTRTGQGVIGIGSPRNAKDWNISAVSAVRDAITRLTRPDEQVFALWPGYLVGSERESVPFTENHFGLRIGDELSLDNQERFRVMGIRRISRMISEGRIPLVVGHKSSFRGEIRGALKVGGYQRVEQLGQVELYKRATKDT